MITRLTKSRILTLTIDIKGSGNITNGHLIRVFLDLELLKFNELRSSRLQIESTTGFVGLTVLRLAHFERHERSRLSEWLIGLGTASVARISGYL